jgi:hypothetical protein
MAKQEARADIFIEAPTGLVFFNRCVFAQSQSKQNDAEAAGLRSIECFPNSELLAF